MESLRYKKRLVQFKKNAIVAAERCHSALTFPHRIVNDFALEGPALEPLLEVYAKGRREVK